MKYCIQSVILPAEERHMQCKQLFYRGTGMVDERNYKSLILGKGQEAFFDTFLNGCSIEKWKKYTHMTGVSLRIKLRGHCMIKLIGFSMEQSYATRKEYGIYYSEDVDGLQILEFDFPDNNEIMNAFELHALGDCVLEEAAYFAEVGDFTPKSVTFCLATTTNKKEEFILHNVELLKKTILANESEMREEFYMYVIDNGQTLKSSDVDGYHVKLISQQNLGGAGGFARGMYEALHQEPGATHVLLMDDDVLVLPESIRRTYVLLKLLREEYADYFISGAMLQMELPWIQVEDIGSIDDSAHTHPLKRNLDHNIVFENLINEIDFPKRNNSYAAWWYCCIPVQHIKKHGYPMPLFFRGDDIEFGMRCKPNIISMNGICIWHQGFAPRYNPAVMLYQVTRNNLFITSTTNAFPIKALENNIWTQYKYELASYHYSGAEQILDGIEDYLKGPEFMMKADLFECFSNANKKNDSFEPLENLEYSNLCEEWWECYNDQPSSKLNKILFRITQNGQRLFRRSKMNMTPTIIAWDGAITMNKIMMRGNILAINPYAQTFFRRVYDRQKYKDLTKRYKRVKKEYYLKKEEVAQKYQNAVPEMTSESFWKKKWGI